MNSEQNAFGILHGVVKGERPLRELGPLGFDIQEYDGRVSVMYDGDLVIVPEVGDIAAGFRAHLARALDLREWASFILAGSGAVSLEALEGHAAGEHLIEALWDAAETGAVSESAVRVIRRLVDPE